MRNPDRVLDFGGQVDQDGFLDDCVPEMRWLLNHWHERRLGDGLCPRRAIDPNDIPVTILPCLNVLDVVNDGDDYRYCLTGTRNVRERHQDPTGMLVSEAFQADCMDSALASYDYVKHRARPLLRTDLLKPDLRNRRRQERLFLPLCDSDDAHKVSSILVFVRYFRLDARTPRPAARLIPASDQGTVAVSLA